MLVRLQDLKVPQGGSYTIRAYALPIACGCADDDKFVKKYSIGYVVMWRAHMHTPDAGNGPGEHGDTESTAAIGPPPTIQRRARSASTSPRCSPPASRQRTRS